jgi:hypothetical protein
MLFPITQEIISKYSYFRENHHVPDDIFKFKYSNLNKETCTLLIQMIKCSSLSHIPEISKPLIQIVKRLFHPDFKSSIVIFKYIIIEYFGKSKIILENVNNNTCQSFIISMDKIIKECEKEQEPTNVLVTSLSLVGAFYLLSKL